MKTNLEDFMQEGLQIKVDVKQPVIWKHQDCEAGECKGVKTSHRLSLPAWTPGGLMTECLDCGKSRIVKVEQNTNLNPLS